MVAYIVVMYSDKAAILGLKSRLIIEAVKVDGLELPISVRGLTGRERDSFENACFTQRGKNRVMTTENIRAKLLVRAICDEKGERLFTDHEEGELGAIPAQVLDSLFGVAQRLAGLAPTDIEEMTGD
jgi:hypothetical protein